MGGPSAADPSCLCPVLLLNAAKTWLNSALSGGAETISPFKICAADCLVYPAIVTCILRLDT